MPVRLTPAFSYMLHAVQVSVAEERHRGLKEALEVDIASIGGQADKIKVRVQTACMHLCCFRMQTCSARWPGCNRGYAADSSLCRWLLEQGKCRCYGLLGVPLSNPLTLRCLSVFLLVPAG